MNSGKCLDVSGNSTANGAKVQQWDCNGTTAQSFTFN
jgi:glucosylceramidase